MAEDGTVAEDGEAEKAGALLGRCHGGGGRVDAFVFILVVRVGIWEGR